MAEFFLWLSSDTTSANVFIVVFSILVIGITIIYTGAFIQGREISFWPPKISAKPSQLQPNDKLNPAKAVTTQNLTPDSKTLVNTNGTLGYGVSLGGYYQNSNLHITSSEWARYANNGLVKSGWLFTQSATVSHAVVFFKIHLSDNGKGYIHLLSSANPHHAIWLKTSTKFSREQVFCWDEKADTQRTTIWQFEWK